MKIAVIGSGHVGGTLGRRWKAKGHDVTFAGRDDLAGVSASDVIALAVPWNAVESVLRAAGPLTGKVLLDCTNGAPPDVRSGAERVAAWAPGARVVKIFNNTGAANMADPMYGDEAVSMFYAGDDAAAKTTAAQLATDLGFDPVDAGPLANARHLEALAMFIVTLAYQQKMGEGIAFRLLRRS
jgi:8-hydroxy-5-deazaflavin:NADPH oxidoreductase